MERESRLGRDRTKSLGQIQTWTSEMVLQHMVHLLNQISYSERPPQNISDLRKPITCLLTKNATAAITAATLNCDSRPLTFLKR